MKLDPANLRARTEAAVAKGKVKQDLEAQRRQLDEARRRDDERRKAERILEDIPLAAEAAANAGKNRVVIMRGTSMAETEHSLRGAAKLVFDECKRAGLDIAVEFDHDGIGYESWLNLVLRW